MVFKIILFSLLLSPRPAMTEETGLKNPLSAFAETKKEGLDSGGFLGETLEYEISWSFMTVGKAYIKIDRIVEVSTGTYAYHIVSGARSTGFIENFYPVKDMNEALMDVNTAGSYGYYKKISEGKYKRSEWILYDFQNKKFAGETLKKNVMSVISGDLQSEKVFDILSALYYFRVKESKEKETYELNVNTRKNWKLAVKNRGLEKVNTPSGKYKCHVLEPMVGEEGIFAARNGKKLLVYISQKERLPVMLKAEVFIGSVTAKLVRVKKNPPPAGQ